MMENTTGYAASADEVYYGDRPSPRSKSEGRVMDEYGNLGKSLAVLGQAIELLREKLAPVLSPSVPKPENGAIKSTAYESLSPLGESLRSESERVRRFEVEIREIIDRIEV